MRSLFPSAGRSISINGWQLNSDVNHWDNDVTNNPKSALAVLLLAEWSALLTSAGYNINALDDSTEYPYAWNGMRWAGILSLFEFGTLSDVPCKDAGLPIMTVQQMTTLCRRKVCENLTALGITSAKYCTVPQDLIYFDSTAIYDGSVDSLNN